MTGHIKDLPVRQRDEWRIWLISRLLHPGGAGCPEDFYEALTRGKADAVLAAGVFHFGQVRIPELKCFLKEKGIVVR